ncbi:hypothetical protein GT347_14250 [Xylophilus rhododendri]|uniref:Plasmid maintenance protein CcdB n=2 Tax=Xylophilus rhododendri TaxID=2697032 RepID=A0A857JC27_9BURK|nr:hypothetical protein GT347_14250 [Xylophilus rhododendri]
MEAIAAAPRKRAVNLTLNEDLIIQARTLTDNLSATVELLLTGFVTERQAALRSHRDAAEACAQEWNAVHDRIGSFADEHSTL